MVISHWYWHLVVKNGSCTLVLTSSGQEWQFHNAMDILWSKMVNALNTTTPKLADIEDILAWSLKYRCLDYQYTKSVSHIGQCRYKPKSDVPHQLSIDVLHTTTPTVRSRTMHIYSRQMDTPHQSMEHRCLCLLLHPLLDPGQCIYIEVDGPPVNWAQMPCIPLHPLLDLGQCIYKEGRWTPWSIKYRCLAYCCTKYISIAQCNRA